jgi:hypothetical protein
MSSAMKQKWMYIFLIFGWMVGPSMYSQTPSSKPKRHDVLDSLYIEEVENSRNPDKVLHAEPLYIDLIRDLGARKGEKEWNVGWGMTDNRDFDAYQFLVEYEWAPIHRLGLEVELPFSLYFPTVSGAQTPGTRLNSFKFAAQYSFFVSEPAKLSMAAGYLHEIALVPFRDYGKDNWIHGNVYSPFFVAAKRWGDRFHTLLYTGPVWEHAFSTGMVQTAFQANGSFHYMIPGTRNFVGLEINSWLSQHRLDVVFRPQMRVAISESMLVGIVTGIPVSKANERFSAFFRLIYEPGHRKMHPS